MIWIAHHAIGARSPARGLGEPGPRDDGGPVRGRNVRHIAQRDVLPRGRDHHRVADGVWVSIGSMNFDNRSLALNDEATLMVLDSAAGSRMERVFLDDLGVNLKPARAMGMTTIKVVHPTEALAELSGHLGIPLGP